MRTVCVLVAVLPFRKLRVVLPTIYPLPMPSRAPTPARRIGPLKSKFKREDRDDSDDGNGVRLADVVRHTIMEARLLELISLHSSLKRLFYLHRLRGLARGYLGFG